MIQNERGLEDYICDNQEEFIESLKNIYGEDYDIKFLGRQVHIGEDNIADLIYYYDEEVILPTNEIKKITLRNYIIVELKFRLLEPKDLAQLSRYISTLNDKLYSDKKYSKYENKINGVFVSLGETKEMQEIIIQLKNEIDINIEFLHINTSITFEKSGWYHAEKYIENLKLDDRIENLYLEK